MWFKKNGHPAKNNIAKKEEADEYQTIPTELYKGIIRGAVKPVREQGYSCNKVAKGPGISHSNVTRWVRQHSDSAEQTANGHQPAGELKAEIRRIKKENQRLVVGREVLKRAAAFDAKGSV